MIIRSVTAWSTRRCLCAVGALLVGTLLTGAAPRGLRAQRPAARTYPALLSLFTEWRAFEEPPRVNGIPDYTPATNVRRGARLRLLQQRLKAIDTSGWSIAEQVDTIWCAPK